MSNCSADFIHERCEARTNLFVLAALRSECAGGPVRVRNVSKTGMLIEGGSLPPNGTKVEIERGSAIATGKIVWVAEGRAGIKLTSKIDIQDWLPRFSRGQLRVDEVVHELRVGKVPAPDAPAGSFPVTLDGTIDLCAIATELESVARSLAGHDQLLAQFPEDLQRLDIATQRLRDFARKPSILDLKSRS